MLSYPDVTLVEQQSLLDEERIQHKASRRRGERYNHSKVRCTQLEGPLKPFVISPGHSRQSSWPHFGNYLRCRLSATEVTVEMLDDITLLNSDFDDGLSHELDQEMDTDAMDASLLS